MDFKDPQTWQYGAIVGGAVLILGLIVCFLPVRKLKIPGGVTAAIGGVAAGLFLGILWMASFGYKPNAPEEPPPDEAAAKGGGGPPGMDKGAPKGGGGAPKGGGGPKGGFGGPGPRQQLVGLVNALETVVDRPVALTLTADDKAAIVGHLKGLDTAESIRDEDAKVKLDAIQAILEKDRKALEAVGYRWATPDAKGGGAKVGFPKDSPNPFADGLPKERLKSLQERLDKKSE